MRAFKPKSRTLGKSFRSEFVPKEVPTFADFKRGKGGRRDSDRRGRPDRNSRRDEGPLEKFPAVCSECGKDCELPFKPTSNKPVFCIDCFRKQDKPDDRSGRDRDRGDRRGSSSPELGIINMKLDKIMKALKIE